MTPTVVKELQQNILIIRSILNAIDSQLRNELASGGLTAAPAATDINAYMSVVANERVVDHPGEMIGYFMYRRGDLPVNTAFAMAKEWAPKYPAALTYEQTFAAVVQGVPYDRMVDGVGLTWDASAKQWKKVDGSVYQPGPADPEWSSWAATFKGGN